MTFADIDDIYEETDGEEDSEGQKKKSGLSFTTLFGFAWQYWRRYPLSMISLIMMVLAVTGTMAIQPLISAKLIDAVALENGGIAEARYYFLALLAAIAGNALLRGAHDYIWLNVASQCMSDVLLTSFNRVQRFSTDWHANSFAGATVRKLTRGMWGLDQFGDILLYGFIRTGLMILGTMIIIGFYWPLMAAVMALVIVGYAALMYVLSTYYVAPANKLFVKEDSRIGAALADAVTCNATVKAFGAEDREHERLIEIGKDWRYHVRRSWRRGVNAGVLQSGVLVVLQAVLLAPVLWLWSQGQATPGQVGLAITTYLVLHGYLRDMGMEMRQIQQAMNDMEDLVNFSNQPLGVMDKEGATDFEPGSGRIVLDRVRFGYANQPTPLYDNFSIEVKPGERVALVGKSGSGKSTFVKLVQRLYDVDGGRVLIDGQDLAHVRQESLRQAIALVPQEPILFHRSLADNIAYGRPGASQKDVEWAAEQAHAAEFITRLNKGYKTLVGERGVKLSGGERQRIAIARAFLADAPILILDEATSSLDSITEERIQDAIARLMRGRTTILIAHRLSTIKMVDRILVFSDGRIVEQGTHPDLVGRPGGHYRALYETQYGAGAPKAPSL